MGEEAGQERAPKRQKIFPVTLSKRGYQVICVLKGLDVLHRELALKAIVLRTERDSIEATAFLDVVDILLKRYFFSLEPSLERDIEALEAKGEVLDDYVIDLSRIREADKENEKPIDITLHDPAFTSAPGTPDSGDTQPATQAP